MSRVRRWPVIAVAGATAALPLIVRSADSTEPSTGSGIEFVRLVAHWDAYGDPGYLPFIREAQPDLVQVGFYGAHFWSLVHTDQYSGYPAHFPVRGIDECAEWFRGLNARIHETGARVVGHFNVEFLIGDPDGPEGPTGFFKWYRESWDESILGPRPVDDPVDLLERGPDGAPIVNRSYAIGGMNEHWACLRNPGWKQVLKAWVRRAVDLGVDGLIANYFYRHDCTCEHCQAGFRDYLRDRFPADALRDRFGIGDLDAHRFDEIVSWHDPAESTPLRREMLRFSQVSNKEVFDEVFIRHGRALKPDLVVAQWNHLGDFSAISGDERCLLPAELWARDESYLWYSTGGAANFTDLENRFCGDATLQARFIRSASGDKPFVLGKYESTRIRAAIAELAANGGAPMGFYTRFTDPAARREIVRYYGFLKRYDTLFRGNRPWSEGVLPFPRSSVRDGDVGVLEDFRRAGRALLDGHVLFDVIPDDMLAQHSGSLPRLDGGASDADWPDDRSRFEAPFTVRVSASVPAGADGSEIDLHFVNYDRVEPPKGADGSPSPGGGIGDEQPIAAPAIGIDFRLPAGAGSASVVFLSPEVEEPITLPATVEDGRLRFRTPEFLVYGVARVLLGTGADE